MANRATRRGFLRATAALPAAGALAAPRGGSRVNPFSEANVYTRLGVKPVINAVGTVTVLGGSIMPPEVVRAMDEASRYFVPVPELQQKVGARIAELLDVPAAMVTMRKGEPKYHTTTSESGNIASRGFCAQCGSPIAAKQSAFPVFIIYAASLDDPSDHRPTMDIFTSSAQPWDRMDPALPKYPKGIG